MLRHLSVGLIATTFTTTMICAGEAQAAGSTKKSTTSKAGTVSVKKASTKSRSRRIASRRLGNYMVPPPPPYSPSILPELAYARMHRKSVKTVEVAEEAEEENTGIYEAAGHESPKGEKAYKGVMNWNKKS
jgi:hypothetical protein